LNVELDKAAVKTAAPPTSARLVSLDVFRGLVIVVMTLVNYLSPVQGVPAWAKHMSELLDGYTFVDVVFPAFLFMVGMSIPFALGRRLERGDSPWGLVRKIAVRSAALLFLGVLTANEHMYAADLVPLSKALWFLLAMLCAVTLCLAVPGQSAKAPQRWWWGLKGAAAVGLVVLLWLFRGRDEQGHVVWLQHTYWGMLGMIGWAYLVSSLCWLVCQNNSTALMGITGLMLALFIGGRHGALDWLGPIQDFVDVGMNFGTNPATVMFGVLVANCLRVPLSSASHWQRLRFILLFGIGLYVAGLLVRPVHGIYKSAHTDAYALVTGGICCLVFAAVYYVVDVLQARRGLGVLLPIGQNALLAYLLPGIAADLLGVFGLSIYWRQSGWPGAVCAAVLTLLILALTWLLSRCRIHLRL
jgi:heparan-alpha-glucosaminide N-acetyltransferase